MSIMGIGPNILGYANETVDRKVIEAIQMGNMSTFNCPEEVELAEKLVSMHHWADMAKFAKSGGEANSIAVRIARAATGKDKVAFCGYHGWHDWYLSSDIGTGTLKEHLFEDTGIAGVPKALAGTSISFVWNDLDSLKAVIDNHKGEVAAVKMEVTRNILPAEGFLEGVRDLCTNNGIVLIFDECTSGFRETFGGLHLKYGINPDLAVFGKALGNGHAVTAVVGRKDVMEGCNSTFLSSTFWSERTGFVAGLATLKEMERLKSWDVITAIGEKVQTIWERAADSTGVSITTGVIPAISTFGFTNSERSSEYRSYMTKELLKHNIVGGNLFFASTAHADVSLKEYEGLVTEIFRTIKKRELGDIGQLVDDKEFAGTTFRRLN